MMKAFLCLTLISVAFGEKWFCYDNSDVLEGCNIEDCHEKNPTQEDCTDFRILNPLTAPVFWCVGQKPCIAKKIPKKTAKQSAPTQPRQPVTPLDPQGCGTEKESAVRCRCELWASGKCYGQEEKLECDHIRDRQRNKACVKAEDMEWCCGTDLISPLQRTGLLGTKTYKKGTAERTYKEDSSKKRVSTSNFSYVEITTAKIIAAAITFTFLCLSFSWCKRKANYSAYSILEDEI